MGVSLRPAPVLSWRRRGAKAGQEMLRSRALGASDNLSKEVWAKTITEASRGSLSGPMEPEDLEAPDYTEPIGKAKGHRRHVRQLDQRTTALLLRKGSLFTQQMSWPQQWLRLCKVSQESGLGHRGL